jgi:dihydrodipicolinate synthase/N-acetylneuraminate lyase
MLLAYREQTIAADNAQAMANYYRECNRKNIEENDRLRAALREIADGPERHNPGAVIKIAKRALGHRASPSNQQREET